MILDKPQTEDLARLHRGTAAVFFEGMEKPAHVLVIPAEEREPSSAGRGPSPSASAAHAACSGRSSWGPLPAVPTT